METKDVINLRVLSYSSSPGPRYCNQGDDSGEDFYHQVLNSKFYEAISSNATLVVDLDGPDGYASSFLDEAFGNLVYDFGISLVNSRVVIKSDEEPEWITMLKNFTFKEWERRRQKNEDPKITQDHSEWYRFVNNKIELKKWMLLSSGK